MIQYPLSGELVVEVPRIGAIILEKPYDYLNRAFGGGLVKGRRVGPQNPGVEWLVGAAVKCGDGDQGAEGARARFLVQADRVTAAADELGRLLRARGNASLVRVPREVLAAIGRSTEKEHADVSRDTATLLAEVLRKGSAGVRRAIDRGYLVTDGGEYRLYGWCFLPPDGVIDPGSPPSLALQYAEEEVAGRPPVQVVSWTLDADAEFIELLRADGGEQVVRGTSQPIAPGARSGQWRFTRRELAAGSSYSARARWADGVVTSQPIRVPGPRPAPPAPPTAPVASNPPSVALEYSFDGPQSTECLQRLRWRVDRPADAISLVRVDGQPHEVEGTSRELAGETEGEWAFPDGTLPGGAQYLARARSSGATGDSNVVTVPSRRSSLSRCRRRCCIRCRRLCSLEWLKWLLAALLALLALALLGWLLFSGSCSGLSLPSGLRGGSRSSSSAPASSSGRDAGGEPSAPSRTETTAPRPAFKPVAPSTTPSGGKPTLPDAVPVPPARTGAREEPVPPAVKPAVSPAAVPAPASPATPERIAPKPRTPTIVDPTPSPPSPSPSPSPSPPAASPVDTGTGTGGLRPPGGRRPIKIVDPGYRRRQPGAPVPSPAPPAKPESSGREGVPGQLKPAGGSPEGTQP